MIWKPYRINHASAMTAIISRVDGGQAEPAAHPFAKALWHRRELGHGQRLAFRLAVGDAALAARA
jgi:hypothetical protein